MKKILSIITFALLISCSKSRESNMLNWIAKAEKPIEVRRADTGITGGLYSYTLIDSKGNIHQANNISMNLPSVLK